MSARNNRAARGTLSGGQLVGGVLGRLVLSAILALLLWTPFGLWGGYFSDPLHVVPFVLDNTGNGVPRALAFFAIAFVTSYLLRHLRARPGNRRTVEPPADVADPVSSGRSPGQSTESFPVVPPTTGPTDPASDTSAQNSSAQPPSAPAGPSVEIPVGSVTSLDAGQRRELAAALGLEWKPFFARNDPAWQAFALQAIRDQRVDPFPS
jgi:hypothetical protein